ncbi:MAG: CTP synthase [Mollicutes bacterium PWAP]|nr:CTP synthase [Mollicutes bacterium PWAP]
MEKQKKKSIKYIFVTGGVVSGLGKGVSAASLGRLLKSKGYNIFVQKLDPYLNLDPGTMDPYEHGEVYVTKDGGETDLDLGHYERFIGEQFNKNSNYTQGKILQELFDEERNGKFCGKTVQIFPQFTNKIIEKILLSEKNKKIDFVITEVGGTIGDMESEPFIKAISEFQNMRETFLIHVTYLPYLTASEELKTKPTQESVAKVMSKGLIPSMLLLRSEIEIPNKILDKVSRRTLIKRENVIPVPTNDSIYKIPLFFNEFKMAEIVEKYFDMPIKKMDISPWSNFVAKIDKPKSKILNIGLIGKYVEFEDAYKSISEALKISAIHKNVKLIYNWIQVDEITKINVDNKLKGLDGIIILPGFGKRGFDGKVIVSQKSWKDDIVTLGICYGFQAMAVAQAKRQGLVNATSSEVDKKGDFVIDIIKGKSLKNKAGILRLGESTTILKKGSIASKIYDSNEAKERHRHKFEVNPKYINSIETKTFIFSGFDKKTNLYEMLEDNSKKFYIGLQAHPEFNSNPLTSHKLFDAFIESIIKNVK